MRIETQFGGASIVLLGNLNPAIFSPLWLQRHGVITPEEADAASVTLISPEFAQFEVADINVNVAADRFSVETMKAPWVGLCDFTANIFKSLLLHTPITQCGINRHFHFSVGDERTRNEIGKLLAPLKHWGAWGKEIAEAQYPLRGGVASLTIQQMWQEGLLKGKVNALVQPSLKIQGHAGIFFQCNDHFEAVDPGSVDGASPIVDFMAGRFDQSIRRAEEIGDQIMSLRDLIK